MLIWATAKAHGAGSLISNTSGVAGVEQAHGAKLAWAMSKFFDENISASLLTNLLQRCSIWVLVRHWLRLRWHFKSIRLHPLCA